MIHLLLNFDHCNAFKISAVSSDSETVPDLMMFKKLGRIGIVTLV